MRARLTLALAILLPNLALAESDREETLCGALRERLVFQMWSASTPSPDPDRVIAHPGISAVEFQTGDGRLLRGYRYAARSAEIEQLDPRGYLLVAMGNAMIADQMIGEFSEYAEAGYDVYVYDYRGYGLSEGRRRIGAIIQDYVELIEDLDGRYTRGLLYGMSLGGMVMMNAIGGGAPFTSAVIDSAPSRLSDQGCPERIDPVENLPSEDLERLLVITGDRDSVLDDAMTGPLREAAERAGARTLRSDVLGHPFMDGPNAHALRTRAVREHLLGR